MIHVVAIITTKPGQREAVLTEFRALLPVVHAEQGCIEYAPVIDAADAAATRDKLGDDIFMVVEKWETTEALRAHSGAPHMAAYAGKVKEMIASALVHVLSPA